MLCQCMPLLRAADLDNMKGNTMVPSVVRVCHPFVLQAPAQNRALVPQDAMSEAVDDADAFLCE